MLAEWSMEPAAAAREPRDLQLSNWAMEPAVYPTIGLPVDYAFAEICGNYCLQTSVPAVSTGGQLIEYAVDRSKYEDQVETTDHQQEFVVDLRHMEKVICDNPIRVFEEVAEEYKADIEIMRVKMHRYPSSIKALDVGEQQRYYTKPMVVSIGPYHHGQEDLQKAERVKHVAAYHCIKASSVSVEEMYSYVVEAAHHARRLYDKDVVAGMSYEGDFLPMMFFDACFLVQYMLIMSDTPGQELDKSLRSFMNANDTEIVHDIMLLENQIPWFVVRAVMRFVHVPVDEFVQSLKGCLQDRKDDPPENKIHSMNYKLAPHLLGLLRFYIVGKSRGGTNNHQTCEEPETTTSSSISFSLSAAELAEIGVRLKPSREATPELIHMGFDDTSGTFFAKLSMAPVSLDSLRASFLINMAALELCTAPNFGEADDEDSAVCSYLLLLAMLVSREEDVQELRTKRLLLGGGGLNNSQALEFFAGVQSLRLGSCYVRIMGDIERYRNTRRTWISVHAFFYNNFKVIAAVVSAIVTIVSILGTLLSIKN